MKRKILLILTLLASVNTAIGQITPTFEEFRILSKANFQSFSSIVNKKGFKQTQRGMFVNNKANELVTKKSNELGFLTTSESKIAMIKTSFNKAGFKSSTAYNALGNPFEGAGDLIWSQVYEGYSDSMIWFGRVKPYDGVEQYFIFFYRL